MSPWIIIYIASEHVESSTTVETSGRPRTNTELGSSGHGDYDGYTEVHAGDGKVDDDDDGKVDDDSNDSDDTIAYTSDNGTDDHDSTDESEQSYDGTWDYVMDPKYKSIEEVPFSASQPCFCVRGVSYTPPGWVRKYNYTKRARANEEKPPAAKKIKLDQ